ncbi:hypothetical protein SDC9_108805 [bioreactor metagenome]|uniref:Uncharacterized protein n=1 Tax=bioreactor metagenome TaxID=1076179 RepID=A0A645BB99_9ZZZZ
MQKVYVNKATNMVDQILPIDENTNYPDDYYSWCYAVLDPNNQITTYDQRYNLDTKEFEKVDDYIEPENIIIPSKEEEILNTIEKLKVKNTELVNELNTTQQALNEMIMSMLGGEI